MSIFIRIWFFFGLVILVGLWFMSYTFNQQVKPNMRQVVEDTLAENANIIAMLVAEDVHDHSVSTAQFDQKIQAALSRKLNAQIWQFNKQKINQQIYLTDAKGIVIYDSRGIAVGQDYSQWNDVYLTLRGQYGVRSTRMKNEDPNSSTMYIAAPIMFKNQIIGVVSIGKPNSSVQPYIQRSEQKLIHHAIGITLFCLFLASLVAYWLKHSIDKVRRYAQALAPVNQAPHFYSAKELNLVTEALENMREQLEGRAYIEHYVNTLTHELKSPLTAIQASAELLKEALPLQDQQQFAEHIHQQSQRLRSLIDRMLLLTRLEKAKSDLELQQFDLSVLLQQLIAQYQSQIQQKNLVCHFHLAAHCHITADRFWMSQAIVNLLDNAIDFAKQNAILSIQLQPLDHNVIELVIFNEGNPIPDFAMTQLFDTYFSLPRPHNQQRSSGIGLSIVKQVIEQHHGQIQISNCTVQHLPFLSMPFFPNPPSGVMVRLKLHTNFI